MGWVGGSSRIQPVRLGAGQMPRTKRRQGTPLGPHSSPVVVSRPQDAWDVKPDNSYAPFVHSPRGLGPEGAAGPSPASDDGLLARAQRLGYGSAPLHPLSRAVRDLEFEEWMLRCDQAQVCLDRPSLSTCSKLQGNTLPRDQSESLTAGN